MMRFFSGLIVLCIAIFLQFQLATAGIHFDFVIAILIAFAFIFEFLELLFFILMGILLVNWQPAPSVALVALALIPILVYAIRKLFHAEPWLGNLVALSLGLFALYLIASPSFLAAHVLIFFEDLIVVLAAGELAFFALH
jgi:hypothetical protein